MEESLAKEFIDLLCSHFGDSVMLEVFLERWGIQTIYSILSDIIVGDAEDGIDETG